MTPCYGPTGKCQRTAPCHGACALRVGHEPQHQAAFDMAFASLLALAIDCRQCAHFSTKSGGCVSTFRCVGANRFKATPTVQYWEAPPPEKAPF